MTGDKTVDGPVWCPGSGEGVLGCAVGSELSVGKTDRNTWTLFALQREWGDCAVWAAMLVVCVRVCVCACSVMGWWAPADETRLPPQMSLNS